MIGHLHPNMKDDPMTDTNTDTGSTLTGNVTSTGPASTKPTYDIAPEDKHIADAILAMDPLNDVPTPHQIPEGWTVPPLRASMLPPAMQADVRAKLTAIPEAQRAAKEPEFVAAAIQSMRADIRIKTGVGSNATPYHREQVGIAREVRDLGQEFDRLAASLQEVERYDRITDPVTGETKPVPVYRMRGTRLAAITAQQDDIIRRIRLLQNGNAYGLEGERRMKQALHESVMAHKALMEQREEAAEAERQAVDEARKERINARAQSLKRLRTNAR